MNKIKYEYKGCFMCENYCTLESKTLMKHGLYGATYIYYNGSNVRPALPQEQFEYSPIVAGIDLEMLSLNPVDPACVLYMASYCSGDNMIVIYTSEYCDQISPENAANSIAHYGSDDYDVSGVTYMQVMDKYELVQRLSEIIAHENPDIVTGYNIYTADFPLLYFTIRSCMGKWTRMCQGPEPYFQYTKKLDKKYIDSEAGIVVKVPGCHVIDMYYFLEHTLPSEDKTSLKLGDVSTKYLGTTKDPFTYRDLQRIYHEGTMDEKIGVMLYCVRDSYLSTQLYRRFNVWNYHSGIYSISGIDPQRSSCTGIVDITYGMCYIETKSGNIYLDEPSNRIFSPGGGLVLKGSKGIKDNVHCVDFSSLYPNITIEHNIDALSVVKCPLDEITAKHGPISKRMYYHISQDGTIVGLQNSKGDIIYFDQTVRTVVPSVLKNLLREREELKGRLKSYSKDSMEYLVTSGQEQARKIGANGTCGAFAEQTQGNPMSYCELNDVITTTGRTILGLSYDLAISKGLEVIYGDTDSLIVKTTGDISSYINSVHKLLPSRIRFKVEYVASKFVMGAKKHYIAHIVDPHTGVSDTKIVGYKAVKSSSCKMAQRVFRWLIDRLLHEGVHTVIPYYKQILDHYSATTDIDVDSFSCRFSYTGKRYTPGTYRYNVVAYMSSRGVELVAGNTLAIVTVKTIEKYMATYGGKSPPVRLPYESDGKSARLYTVDEVGNNVDILDTVDMLEVQCGSDISSIVCGIVPKHLW